jgi:hypothetical protein
MATTSIRSILSSGQHTIATTSKQHDRQQSVIDVARGHLHSVSAPGMPTTRGERLQTPPKQYRSTTAWAPTRFSWVHATAEPDTTHRRCGAEPPVALVLIIVSNYGDGGDTCHSCDMILQLRPVTTAIAPGLIISGAWLSRDTVSQRLDRRRRQQRR